MQLEFKREMPQPRELAKDLAAMASSGGGQVLIGVADDGVLVGVDASAPELRDAVGQQIANICRDLIKPRLHVDLQYAAEAAFLVLVIGVPHTRVPMYYANNVPYLRAGTQARPADPEEVIRAIAKHLGVGPDAAVEAVPVEGPEYSGLVRLLVEMCIRTSHAKDHRKQVNPWLDDLRFNCESWAEELRRIQREDVPREAHLVERLKLLEASCSKLTKALRTLHLGMDLRTPVEELHGAAQALKVDIVDSATIDESTMTAIKDAVRDAALRLRSVQERSADIWESDFRAIQDEASRIGQDLGTTVALPLPFLDTADAKLLRETADRLHLLDVAIPEWMDGGQSVERMRDDIAACADILERLAVKAT